VGFYAEKHELLDGAILLYRRRDKSGVVAPAWQMRLKLPRRPGYVTLSCKTTNFVDAAAYAKEKLLELSQKVRQGVPLKQWTFNRHWRDWYDRQVAKGAWKPQRQQWHLKYFSRYFSAYFGDMPLDDITYDFADGYWGWRVSYWSRQAGLIKHNPKRRGAKTMTTANAVKAPAPKTLEMEATALNQIFKDANQQRRLTYPITVKAPKKSGSKRRRPSFDQDEWTELQAHLSQWTQQKGPYADDRLNAYQRFRRFQLHCYVLFVAGSGVRPGTETREMRWADITEKKEGGRPWLRIEIRENTKRGTRTAVGMPGAAIAIRKWKAASLNADPQALIWVGQGKMDEDQEPFKDLNKTFQAFLTKIPYKGRPNGLLKDANGKNRTLYSLRHLYVSMRRLHGEANDLTLAENMGTSARFSTGVRASGPRLSDSCCAATTSLRAEIGPDADRL